MPQLIADPILGPIELDTWVEELLRESEIAREKKRLERIKNLGLIHHSFPSATHSKWEHHLGMYHLAKQIPLNAEESRRLQILCLMGGIGHLPFTYATEESILLAAKLSARFRSQIEKELETVWQMCQHLSHQPRSTTPYKEVLADVRVEALHAWLGASKLKGFSKDIALGDRNRLVYDRIDQATELNKLYRFIARLDYVQRDLYYTGIARFSLSAGSLLRRYRGSIDDLLGTAESNLLDELRSYLSNSLYFDVRSLCLEALFKKQLAGLVVSEAVTLRDLLRWNDEQIETALETRAGKGWWDSVLHAEFTGISRTKVGMFRRNILDVEANILRPKTKSRKFLTRYPSNQSFIIVAKRSVDTRDRWAGADVFLSVVRQPAKITPIAGALSNMERLRRERPRRERFGVRKTLGEDLLAYLLGCSVRFDNHPLAGVFWSGFVTLPRSSRRHIEDILEHKFYLYAVGREIEEVDYWRFALRQSSFGDFLASHSKDVWEVLRNAANGGKQDMSLVIEAASWVREHLRLSSLQSRWVLPNVVLETNDGPRQIDVVSLFVRGKRTILRLIECSKSDSETKAVGDRQKLDKIEVSCKKFADLRFEKRILGASSVRDDFLPVQPILKKLRVRRK